MAGIGPEYIILIVTVLCDEDILTLSWQEIHKFTENKSREQKQST